MANPILLKRSNVPGRVPTTSSLGPAEVAVNTNDKRLFFGTNTSVAEVVVNNNLLPLDVANFSSGILTIADFNPHTLDSLLLTDARSLEYNIQATSASGFQLTKILVLHDNITPLILEYGSIATGPVLFTLDASIYSSSLDIIAVANFDDVTYKFVRTVITV